MKTSSYGNDLVKWRSRLHEIGSFSDNCILKPQNQSKFWACNVPFFNKTIKPTRAKLSCCITNSFHLCQFFMFAICSLLFPLRSNFVQPACVIITALLHNKTCNRSRTAKARENRFWVKWWQLPNWDYDRVTMFRRQLYYIINLKSGDVVRVRRPAASELWN